MKNGRGEMSVKFLGMERPLIGVVHLLPLPGSPRYEGKFDRVVWRALSDAKGYVEAGFSALIVENFGDAPFFPRRVPPSTVGAMAVAVAEVAKAIPVPVGVNILRNDLISALSVAHVSGGKFVRANLLLGLAAAPEGWLLGEAAEALRLRALLKEEVKVLADVSVKHAKSLWASSLDAEVKDLIERGLAEGIIVTGRRTGEPPQAEELRAVKGAAEGRVPVFLGGGLTPENAPELLPHADGAIVGTYVKREGRIEEQVDFERARELVEVAWRVWGVTSS